MSPHELQRDLIVLAADADIAAAVEGLLQRTPSLGIFALHADIRRHPEHDPGCRLKAHEFLRAFTNKYAYAIVLYDREGCGAEAMERQALQLETETLLAASGWSARARAVVIDPEVETWIWSDSPRLPQVLGWPAQQLGELRGWLSKEGWAAQGMPKPARPKEALDALRRKIDKPRSSAVFGEVARSVGLDRCVDPAFLELRSILIGWFGRAP